MARDHNGKLIKPEEESCEKIIEDLWGCLYHSDDPVKKEAADNIAPSLSLREKLHRALFSDDRRKTYFICKIIQKYIGPKGIVPDHRAKPALKEVNSYNEPPSKNISDM